MKKGSFSADIILITMYVVVFVFVMTCLIVLLLRLFFFFFFFSHQYGRDSKLPKGSMGWPFIGETLGLLTPHESISLGRFLQQHTSRYGKVFKSHLFGSPTIVSCDHELNMFVLQNEEKLFRASYPKAMHGILGKYSLLMVSGDLHKKLRSMIVNFISVTKSAETFRLCSERLTLSVLRSWQGQTEVSFLQEAKAFTLNMLVKTLLNIEPEESRAATILQDFLTFMRGFVSLPLYIPGTPYAMAIKARGRLCSTVKDIIEERKKRGETGRDFLDVIISKEELSEEERVSLVLDILLAGYETTSTVISLLVYFLARAPLAFHTLKEEHKAIRRKKEHVDEPLSLEDYKQMRFTDHVIWETLRCGNVVKFLHRRAIQDIEYKGRYVIPSGWKVLPVIAVPHSDPTLHENPLEFNPWRWEKEETKKNVLPFGGGSRLCPGGDFAKVEIASFLHHLILNYKWKVKEDEVPLAYPYIEFKRGLHLEIEQIVDHNYTTLKP